MTRRLAVILLLILFFLNCAANAAEEKKPAHSTMLHGEVDETSLYGTLNSSLGLQTEKQNGVLKIKVVKLGTPAYYHGLRAGDAILDEHADGGRLILRIQRDGAVFQTSLASATARDNIYKFHTQTASTAPFSASASTSMSVTPARLLDEVTKQQIIARHDIVLIVDRSGSMSTPDCPDHRTRWQWVLDQSVSFTSASAKSLPNGITLLLFNNSTDIIPHVTAAQLPAIFAQYSPAGGTLTEDAVGKAISDFFNRQHQWAVKPLAIAVISDGLPNRPQMLKQVIIDATNNMRDPHDISISFIQIADDKFAHQLLQELDSGLVSEGAKYDIVDVKYFDEVNREGLLNAIVDAINEKR